LPNVIDMEKEAVKYKFIPGEESITLCRKVEYRKGYSEVDLSTPHKMGDWMEHNKGYRLIEENITDLLLSDALTENDIKVF